MTSQAKSGTGIYVVYNGTVYAELTDVNDPPFTMGKADATSHDSTYEVSIPSIGKFGDLTFKAFFVNDTAQAALRVLAVAKTVGVWQVVYPSAFSFLTYSCPGFVSSLKHTTPQKGALATYEISITPTEAVTEITTTGNPLTGAIFVVTDEDSQTPTITPTASGTTYVYDCTMLQAVTASYTITPTAAAGTIYVNGTIVSSGAASSAIGYTLANFPTGSVKTDFIVVTGTGKVPIIYRLRLTRGTA